MIKLYETIIENDLNPFILFSSAGKLIKFNKEAEFIFNYVSIKELYNLAIEHASLNYGTNKQYIHLKYNKQSYYAILVAYLDDEQLALRLYKEIEPIKNISTNENYKTSNIFLLLNLSKNTNLTNNNIILNEVFDTSIPEFKIDINQLLLNLNSMFSSCNSHKELKINIHLKTGEFEIINNKKYNVLCIKFTTLKPIDFILHDNDKNSTINLYHKNNKIELELPLIL